MAGRRPGRLRRAVGDLTALLEATMRVAAQARWRLAGVTPDGASRRDSRHDGDARPLAKGRLGKPVEFGYKAQVVDDDGIVHDQLLPVQRRAPPVGAARQVRHRNVRVQLRITPADAVAETSRR